MQRKRGNARAGFTLVELTIVLAIVVVLASLAIPTFARLLPGSRDEVSGTAQTLFSIIKAAKIYAAQHRVDTAVVYTLDNYVDPPAPNVPGLREPIQDSILQTPVRVITGVAIMAANPGKGGVFVPVTLPEGNFTLFPNGVSVLLNDPENGETYFFSDTPRYPLDDEESPAVVDRLYAIGMSSVEAYIGQDPYGPGYAEGDVVRFPAHVFKPSGQLAVSASKQRFEIHVARTPSAPREQRLLDPDNPGLGLQTIPIELYRSTGRVRVVS